MTFKSPLHIRFWTDLKDWSDKKIFRYGGPAGALDSTPMFMSQECVMMMQPSGSRGGIVSQAKFDVGYGMLPYYSDVKGAHKIALLVVPHFRSYLAIQRKNIKVLQNS